MNENKELAVRRVAAGIVFLKEYYNILQTERGGKSLAVISSTLM